MTDAQLDMHLKGFFQKYPELRTEIEQSVVRDTRQEIVVRQMVERSVDDLDWDGTEDELELHDNANGLG